MMKLKFNKIFIITILLLITSSSVFAATNEEIVNSFKQYVDNDMSKILETYKGNYYSLEHFTKSSIWKKSVKSIDPNYKFDVQSTNSLISPYKAILEVTQTNTSYENEKTKEMAINSTKVSSKLRQLFRITLAYQDNNWVITNVQYIAIFVDGDRQTHNIEVIQSLFEYLKNTDDCSIREYNF